MRTTTDFDTIKVLLLPRLHRPTPGPGRALVPGHLHIDLILDTVEGDVEVTEEDLEAWEVSFDSAYEAAMENLKARSSPSEWQRVDTVPGMHFYMPGTTDASIRALILDELLEEWPMEGVLFAVPSSNQLLIVPLETMADLAAIRVLVTSTHLANQSATTPLTDQLFWVDGGKIHHIQVDHFPDDVQVIPPPAFMEVMERLSTMSLISAAGEA